MHALDERINVLIADHDPWTRHSLATPLLEAGFVVHEASNGMSALRSAVATPPRVVLVGPRLSEVSTAQVLRSLRTAPATRHAALILIGGADPAYEVDAHIELPCNAVELLSSVIRALRPTEQEDRHGAARRRVLSVRAPWGTPQLELAPMRSVLAPA